MKSPTDKKFVSASKHLSVKEHDVLNVWYSRFQSWHSNMFDTPPSSGWGGKLAWGTSYAVEDILDMFERAPTEKLANFFFLYADSIFDKRESIQQDSLDKCKYSNLSANAPVWINYIPASSTNESHRQGDCWSLRSVITGMVLKSIARGIRILEPYYETDSIGQKKLESYVLAIKLTLSYHEDTQKGVKIYRSGIDSKINAHVAHCIGCDDTEIQSTRANIPSPLNFHAAFGGVYLELSYKSSFYMNRAIYFARFIKDTIGSSTSGLGTWAYWPHYDNSKIEDTSHGAIVAQFVFKAFKQKIVFEKSDLENIVSNFKLNVVLDNSGVIDLATKLDGTVALNSDGSNKYHSRACGNWLHLADLYPELLNICKEVCQWDPINMICTRNRHNYRRAEAQFFKYQDLD